VGTESKRDETFDLTVERRLFVLELRKATPSSMFSRDPPLSDRVRRPRLRPSEPTQAT
jgi:hypothetical protein